VTNTDAFSTAIACQTDASAAGTAALRALGSLVHCPAGRSTSCSILEHFPLAQALSSRVPDAADRGQDADKGLLASVRQLVGEAVAASPHCLAVMKEWVATADGQGRDLLVLQVSDGDARVTCSHWSINS
jgi:hypothetical protein